MEREKTQITLPLSKKVVVLKKWLTGRERKDFNSAIFSGQEFSPNEDFKPVIKGEMIGKLQDEQVKAYVESIDDIKDNILEIVLDLRDKDYNFILSEINKLSKEEEESLKV
jgi:hypothetical protein